MSSQEVIIVFPTAMEAAPFIAKHGGPVAMHETGVPAALHETGMSAVFNETGVSAALHGAGPDIVFREAGVLSSISAAGLSVALCGVGLAECAASTARIICERHPRFMILAGIAGAYAAKEPKQEVAGHLNGAKPGPTNYSDAVSHCSAAYSESNLAHDLQVISKGTTVLVSRENSADLGSMSNGAFKPLSKNPAMGKTTPASVATGPAYNFYDCPTPLPDIFPAVVSNSVNTAATEYINTLLPVAAIENMEGAAFFAVCRAMKMPCAEIRVVSNFVGEPHSEWITGHAVEILSESLTTLLETLNAYPK